MTISPRSLAASLATVALVAAGATAVAAPQSNDNHTDRPFTFAVIGDVPYGQEQYEAFPGQIAEINADEDVQLVIHVGDTKSGGDVCSDEWNHDILGFFNDFEDPLVYTPGDNEWTDCHRESNGQYNPLERLDAIKSTYFAKRGKTLGQNVVNVRAQGRQSENVTFVRDNVQFVTAHVTGSNNGKLPWKGLGKTEATPEQVAEYTERGDNAVRWIAQTFSQAKNTGKGAVVLALHADMFYHNGEGQPSPSEKYASEFAPIVREIARQANCFDGNVYLINGDSHEWRVDTPLDDQVWMDFYGSVPAPNVTRITVDGSKNANNYLKATIDGFGMDKSLSYERVPFSS